VFQALVNNSNQRFDPRPWTSAPKRNCASTWPIQTGTDLLPVAAGQEDRRRRIARHPSRSTGEERQGLAEDAGQRQPPADHRPLAQALPAREAGAEVSLAIAGVAADSLSSMIPGLLGGGQAQGMLNGQRQRLMEQIGSDLNNTLLYVYRDLSDDELEEFATFAESAEGKAYYQAALAAIRAGLAVGQSTSNLAQ
jgi:hypothetical protein